jgi:hypothetical protein
MCSVRCILPTQFMLNLSCCVCVCARMRALVLSKCVLLFHSCCNLYNRSTVSSRARPPQCDIVLPISISNIISSFSSCLCLLPHLPITYILSSIFSSVMYFKRLFLHKKWPVQLAFFLFIVCRVVLSSSVICCHQISMCAEYMSVHDLVICNNSN